MSKNKDNYISTAKAIAIILMVTAHSFPPQIACSFIALFHMPVFFFYSGYFLKIPKNWSEWKVFAKKRVKGLYFPYLKWSIAFLLLHNVFYYMHFYHENYVYYNVPQHLYDWHDYLLHLFFIITSMNYHEQLLGGFWFLKVLLLAAILVSVVLFVVGKNSKMRLIIVAFSLWGLTIVFKMANMQFLVVGKLYLVTFGALFYLSGYIYKCYEERLQVLNKCWVLYFAILSLVALFYGGGLSMTSLKYYEIAFYPILALMGISLTTTISKAIERIRVRQYFYYIGKHTMIILALHMTAFKIISLVKIEQYSMMIDHLAEFPVIISNNQIYWIIYTVCGVGVPLICHRIYTHFAYIINE